MFVYMIRHKTDLRLFYIGSTNDFNKRMGVHKSRCFNENSRLHDMKVYKIIREFGWDEFDAFIIDVCVTDDRDILEEMEKQYIWDMKPTMNVVDYTHDNKQYHRQYAIDNRDRLSEYQSIWRANNDEKLRQYRRDTKNMERANQLRRNGRIWKSISKEYMNICL